MSRRPQTDIEKELLSISRKMKELEKQNERLGGAIEIALDVLEKLWLEKPQTKIKTALKRMMKLL